MVFLLPLLAILALLFRARPTPAQFVSAWSAGISGSGNKYSTGLQGGKSWLAGYTNAQQQMIAGLQAAIADGRMVRHAQALGDAGFVAAATQKGQQNFLASGTNPTNQQKMGSGVNVLYGYLDTADQAIANTPRGNLQTNIQRMTTYVTTVAQAAAAYKASH